MFDMTEFVARVEGVELLVEKLKSLKVERINNKDEITIQPFNHSTVKLRKQYAFTLAEVLITIGIIGVVAVLTIPALITHNQEKGWNTASTVFEAKLNEALNVMNTQQVLAGYKTTEDFVNELQNHMKITKICQNDDILSCFEDKVTWNNEEVDMESIKKASHFGESWETNTNLLGLQFANGTSAIVGYDTKCKQDPFSNQVTGTSCLAMLYDTSGFANPNEQGKDLRSINVKSLSGNAALCLPSGTCFTSMFRPTTLTPTECEARKDELGISNCITSQYDFWAGAAAACGGVKNLPSLEQLSELANYLYNTNGIGATQSVSNVSLDYNKLSSLGAINPGSALYIWTNIEATDEDPICSKIICTRVFNQTTFTQRAGGRGNSDRRAICLAK